jgi:phosphodiesterase/alkaline phosphatase D-like protein
VYADSIWDQVSSIKRWNEKSRKERRSAQFTKSMQDQVPDFYFKLYCDRWSQSEVQNALASIPSVMMWDDHDIFDGWGSHDPDDQASLVFKGIYDVARNHFRLFQQHIGPDEDRPGRICSGANLSFGYTVGSLALLVLDMRSERSESQVISKKSWKQILGWLGEFPEGKLKHLFVMTSIPVVHPDFSLIESLLRTLPRQQELEDDLKDHWHSRGHKAERLRFIHRLLKCAHDKDVRITLLSGDVHVAAVGVIESQRQDGVQGRSQVINQLTSSAIVHPAPPGMFLFALEHLMRDVEEVDQRISAEMMNFPGTRQKFIGSRNWLSLEPDDVGRIWANWYVEGESEEPHTKVIHPVDTGREDQPTDAIA